MTRRPSLRDRRRRRDALQRRSLIVLTRRALTLPTEAVQRLMAYAHQHRICLWQALLVAIKHNAVPGLDIEIEEEGGAR